LTRREHGKHFGGFSFDELTAFWPYSKEEMKIDMEIEALSKSAIGRKEKNLKRRRDQTPA
jgi:hypothetical protein